MEISLKVFCEYPFVETPSVILWLNQCSASGEVQLASLSMGSLPRKRALLSAQVPTTATSIMVIHSQSLLYKSLLPTVLKGVSIYLSYTQSIPSFNEMTALYISSHSTFNSLGKYRASTS